MFSFNWIRTQVAIMKFTDNWRMTIGLNVCIYLNLSGNNEISQIHNVEVPVRGKQIITEMITKAISKMATSTAAGPSCLVADILKPIWKLTGASR